MAVPLGMTSQPDGPTAAVAEALQATAFVAAACRAEESRQPSPRLVDPLAQLFVDAQRTGAQAGRALLAAGRYEVVARTVLIDQLLVEAMRQWPSSAVVSLGAGFCTRPYRLDLSSCRLVVELDAAGVIALKDRLLAGASPTCQVRRISADIRDAGQLRSCLAIPELLAGPTIVITEGLLVYLPESDLCDLARTLSDAPPVVRWLTDVVSAESTLGMGVVADRAGAGLELFGLDSLEPFESAGWTVTDYRILPVTRPAFGGSRAAATGGGRAAARSGHTAVSRRVVDGVVAIDRR